MAEAEEATETASEGSSGRGVGRTVLPTSVGMGVVEEEAVVVGEPPPPFPPLLRPPLV